MSRDTHVREPESEMRDEKEKEMGGNRETPTRR